MSPLRSTPKHNAMMADLNPAAAADKAKVNYEMRTIEISSGDDDDDNITASNAPDQRVKLEDIEESSGISGIAEVPLLSSYELRAGTERRSGADVFANIDRPVKFEDSKHAEIGEGSGEERYDKGKGREQLGQTPRVELVAPATPVRSSIFVDQTPGEDDDDLPDLVDVNASLRTPQSNPKPKPKPKRRTSLRRRDEEFDLGLLQSRSLADVGSGEAVEALVRSDETRSDVLIAKWVRDAPNAHRKDARRDARDLKAGRKSFAQAGHSIRLVDGEKWLVKGMTHALHNHQLIAAGWMLRREEDRLDSKSGMLADEMGFGKTIITIAMMMANPPKPNRHRPTLIVCMNPDLMDQWHAELLKFLVKKDRSVRVHLQHATQRTTILSVLEDADYVLTTYSEVRSSWPSDTPPKEVKRQGDRAVQDWWKVISETKRGLLHQVNYHRVVIDESHFIKNYKTASSKACAAIRAERRWALSGTPISNRVSELYAYFKYLQYPGLTTMSAFKTEYCTGSSASTAALKTLLSPCMKRRTHANTCFGKRVISLPPSTTDVITLEFNEIELLIYKTFESRFRERMLGVYHDQKLSQKQKAAFLIVLLNRLRQLTAHVFLVEVQIRDMLIPADVAELKRICTKGFEKQSQLELMAAKLADECYRMPTTRALPDLSAEERKKMNKQGHGSNFAFRQLLPVGEDNLFEQLHTCIYCKEYAETAVELDCNGCIMCFGCITDLLDGDVHKNIGRTACPSCGKKFKAWAALDDAGSNDVNGPAAQYRGVSMQTQGSSSGSTPATGRKRPRARKVEPWIDLAGDVLSSPKTRAVVERLATWWREDPDCKVLVYTMWAPMVDMLGRIFDDKHYKYVKYYGKMGRQARTSALETFKTDPSTKIFLASMKCGSLGLNLTEANRVLNMDLWWNDTLESQIFGRAHRIGQQKETLLTRLVIANTIDQKMLQMQAVKHKTIARALGDKRDKSNGMDRLFSLLSGQVDDPDRQDDGDEEDEEDGELRIPLDELWEGLSDDGDSSGDDYEEDCIDGEKGTDKEEDEKEEEDEEERRLATDAADEEDEEDEGDMIRASMDTDRQTRSPGNLTRRKKRSEEVVLPFTKEKRKI